MSNGRVHGSDKDLDTAALPGAIMPNSIKLHQTKVNAR